MLKLTEGLAKALFDFSRDEMNYYKIFEGTKLFPLSADGKIEAPKIASDAVDVLSEIISYIPYRDQHLFRINAPIRVPALRPMNEMLAIYGCMFYLGSLVRYNPQYLESILWTKHSWMIERFIKSAPITFLRHFRNFLDGNYIAYVSH
jgi:hypothetical protein